MGRIEALQEAIHTLEQEQAAQHARALELVAHGRAQASRLNDFFPPQLQTTKQRLEDLLRGAVPASAAGWEPAEWKDWAVAPPPALGLLRCGEAQERRSQGQFAFPVYVPFIGHNKTIIIQSATPEEARLAERLLQSLVVRTALMLPHQASYTLLDPAGNGRAFPMRRSLPAVTPNGDDAARDLDAVISEIRRKIETYLDASVRSFECIPDDVRINERFHLVFAADFPNKYDRRAIEKLQSASITGPQAGTYVFIHYHSAHELPRDITMAGFENAFTLRASETSAAAGYPLILDSTPQPEVQQAVFDQLASARPVDRIIAWEEAVGIAEERWWQHTSAQLIETPIGKRGGSSPLRIWFGEGPEGQPCAHGVLGAMTGSGKSSLYHTLILGLAVRYSPAELRLYLIDGKHGVEFKPYQHLPHAEVVSLRTSAELSRSVLAELSDEMARRNAIFTRAGATALPEYRAKGQPEGPLPRVLLIVDEYQQLFEDDRDGAGSTLLAQLAAQGRSAGIHLLLASQRFGAAGMLNQASIFGNLHLRLAMQMAEADIRALTEFGPRGKALILATCNLPGKIVLNDRASDENANVAGKAAYLAPKERERIISALIERAGGLPAEHAPRRVIFNGTTQPDLTENPLLAAMLADSRWPDQAQLEQVARRPDQEQGWGVPDWHIAERPSLMWLGQEFNVRGQAALVLRRRTGEHAAVVGGNAAARYGMLAAMLASIAVTCSPQDARFVIVDRSIPGAAWSGVLAAVCDELLRPAGFTVAFNQTEQALGGMLGLLVAELDRRRAAPDDETAARQTIYVLLTEAERLEPLRRQSDAYGMVDSPVGELLRRLYAEGAALGIHIILSTSGVRALTAVLDEKRGLPHFRHRIALQMSEDESFTFVRSRRATALQSAEPRPVSALYADMDLDQPIRFKPYSAETDPDSPAGTLVEQLRQIGARLAARSSHEPR